MAPKRKSGVDNAAANKRRRHEDAANRPRNKASPLPLVTVSGGLSPAQKKAVKDMCLHPLLDIKCSTLHNPLIDWLGGLYDSDNREIVVPGRGRIPVNEHSCHRIMGLPRGDQEVIYAMDEASEAELAAGMFGADGATPKITRVGEILAGIESAGARFKRVWLMYANCSLLAPTTSNLVSSRCNYFLRDIDNVHNLNWAKFVADQLHNELSKDKWTKACLFYYMMLYIDALDISHLSITLPIGDFPINVWSKENIDLALLADLKKDKKSYGKLQLKPQFGSDFTLFGGPDGFDRWTEVNTAPGCPTEQRVKASALMRRFSSGIVGLMGALVQGWTGLNPDGSAEISAQFGLFNKGFASTSRRSPRIKDKQHKAPGIRISSSGRLAASNDSTSDADDTGGIHISAGGPSHVSHVDSPPASPVHGAHVQPSHIPDASSNFPPSGGDNLQADATVERIYVDQESKLQEAVPNQGAVLVESAGNEDILPKESMDKLQDMASDLSKKDKQVVMDKEQTQLFLKRLVAEELGIPPSSSVEVAEELGISTKQPPKRKTTAAPEDKVVDGSSATEDVPPKKQPPKRKLIASHKIKVVDASSAATCVPTKEQPIKGKPTATQKDKDKMVHATSAATGVPSKEQRQKGKPPAAPKDKDKVVHATSAATAVPSKEQPPKCKPPAAPKDKDKKVHATLAAAAIPPNVQPQKGKPPAAPKDKDKEVHATSAAAAVPPKEQPPKGKLTIPSSAAVDVPSLPLLDAGAPSADVDVVLAVSFASRLSVKDKMVDGSSIAPAVTMTHDTADVYQRKNRSSPRLSANATAVEPAASSVPHLPDSANAEDVAGTKVVAENNLPGQAESSAHSVPTNDHGVQPPIDPPFVIDAVPVAWAPNTMTDGRPLDNIDKAD